MKEKNIRKKGKKNFMAIQLMVVDQDVNFTEGVKQYFKDSSSITVTQTFRDREAINYVKDYNVLVLNMFLDGIDSIEILKAFKIANNANIVIATSDFLSKELADLLSIYNVNYYMKKPYSNEDLEKMILTLCKDNNTTFIPKNNKLRIEITNVLHTLGIPSHIKGYNYIRDGVEMLYNDSSLSGAITRELYPSIANNYNTTSSRVERAIRHAIEVSWIRGDYKAMEKLFGNSVDFDRSKPTNSEFIATIADRLKLEKNV